MQQRQDPYNQLSQLLGLAGQVGNTHIRPDAAVWPQWELTTWARGISILISSRRTDSIGGGLISGAGQAGIAAFSDRRIKRNIKKLGEFGKGISWYAFRYIGDAKKRVGFMADEVREGVAGRPVHDVGGVVGG